MKKVLIYGAGANGVKTASRLDPERAELAGFVDRDTEKQKKGMNGSRVYAPAELNGLLYDILVIANYKYYGIREELIHHCGVDGSRIINYYEYPMQTERLQELFLMDGCKADILEWNMQLKEQELLNAPYEWADRIKSGEIKVPDVRSPRETIDRILREKKSICRFGDGELAILRGIYGCGFQKADPALRRRLEEIIKNTREDVLVGLHDGYGSLDYFTPEYRIHLRRQASALLRRYSIYPFLNFDSVYYSAYFTRVWSTTHHEEETAEIFASMKQIWAGRECVFIEGEKTRLGVGNDLFAAASGIERIICPAEGAFDKYDEILKEARKCGKDKLLLLALGPTATVLAYDLAADGYQALDIGHVDIEYEWYLMRAYTKTAIRYKYVNEVRGGNIVEDPEDLLYRNQITARI